MASYRVLFKKLARRTDSPLFFIGSGNMPSNLYIELQISCCTELELDKAGRIGQNKKHKNNCYKITLINFVAWYGHVAWSVIDGYYLHFLLLTSEMDPFDLPLQQQETSIQFWYNRGDSCHPSSRKQVRDLWQRSQESDNMENIVRCFPFGANNNYSKFSLLIDFGPRHKVSFLSVLSWWTWLIQQSENISLIL